jgi:chaperonin GroEL
MIEKHRTLFLKGSGAIEAISNRIEKIQEYIDDNETEFMNKNQYRERIGNLKGRIAVIRVGAPSLLQMHEGTHRIQSALAFVRAVVSGGVLPGGGSALTAISDILWADFHEKEDCADIQYGKLLILEAIRAPAKTFVRKDGLGVIESLKIMTDSEGRIGYNVVSHEFADMKKEGIYDAATVVLAALNQAVSIVYEWLNTEVLMVSVSPDQEDIALMKQGVPIMR